MESIEIILISIIFGYGVALGFVNTFNRIRSIFKGSYSQNTVGVLLDSCWYGVIIFYLLKYM